MATAPELSGEQPAFSVRVTPAVRHEHAPAESWSSRLDSGDRDAVWDAFLETYRRLIFFTIGRIVRDAEARMDVFALVCERLREDDFRRLRAFDPAGSARFTTWLTAVVRNIAVDWHRGQHGRRRASAFEDRLNPLHRVLFRHLNGTGRSYVETYEYMRSAGEFSGTFPAFLREVRDLYQRALTDWGPMARELVGSEPTVELETGPLIPDDTSEDAHRVLAALATLSADVRAATLLFVVDGVPADQVARIVGWPNRKAVYNRVRRALTVLRRRLGIGAHE